VADDDTNELIDPAEIASLMNSAIEAPGIPPFAPLDLETALSNRLAEARPYELPSFDAEHYDVSNAELTNDGDADVELHIELGRALLPVEEGGTLREGAVVSLDKLAGDPVDILVDGRLIARGEVLVLNDKFCVRVAEIIGSSFAMETRSASAVA
jgi:flagellar motor switch protein FliN